MLVTFQDRRRVRRLMECAVVALTWTWAGCGGPATARGEEKKNSILEVDYTNVLRRRGVPLETALVEASRTRLRPILMTTIAIIAGLVPAAFGEGAGARQRGDIAVTIIGGQTLCLFLTCCSYRLPTL